MDVKWVFDIIDGHLNGYHEEYYAGLIEANEYLNKIEALTQLRTTLETFIKEANAAQIR